MSTVSLLLTCHLSAAYGKKYHCRIVGNTPLKSRPLPVVGESSRKLAKSLAHEVVLFGVVGPLVVPFGRAQLPAHCVWATPKL